MERSHGEPVLYLDDETLNLYFQTSKDTYYVYSSFRNSANYTGVQTCIFDQIIMLFKK